MPLQVTVTPDITVDNNTVITADVLNRLGSPTVDVRGTLDGVSSANIADGAVTNAKLANPMPANTVKGVGAAGVVRDLVLDSTLTAANSDSPIAGSGTLKVADGGITAVQLANNSVGTSELTDLAVTLPKMAPLPPSRLVGNPSSTRTDVPEPIALGIGLSFSPAQTVATGLTRKRVNNISTIMTNGAHGFLGHDVVNITGAAVSSFNVYGAVITGLIGSPANGFTYDNPGPDDPTPNTNPPTSDTGIVIRSINNSKLVAAAGGVAVAMTKQLNEHNTLATYTDWGNLPTWSGDNASVADNPLDNMLVFIDDHVGADGTNAFQLSYTPVNPLGRLLVEVAADVYCSSGATGWLALFRDPLVRNPPTVPVSTQAIAVGPFTIGDAWFGVARVSCVVPAAAAVATVFKLKFAGISMHFNGASNLIGFSYTAWDGQAKTIMRVTELPP